MAKKSTKKTGRGYSKRKIRTRELRQRFLIVCEGEATECNYFNSFRVPKDVRRIDIVGLGKNPTQVVAKAKEYEKQDDYDQVWCVFDRDSWKAQDFNNALQQARQAKFKVAYSNQSFELWYLLHFEYLNNSVSVPRKDYYKKLEQHLGHYYDKNSKTMYQELKPYQSQAIKYAKKLLKQYPNSNPADDDPSTTVHQLVQELNKFAR